MAPFNGIRACVFDAYGTLFDIHAPTARVAGELGDQADAISNTWRQKQLQYTWLRSLMRDHADFWQVTGDALDFTLAAHGIKNAALRERLMELYLTIDAYPDAISTLGMLKQRGYATAVLSNGAQHMLGAAVDNSGLVEELDHVLSIDGLDVYKPDPSTYQLAVDRLGVEPGQICFVSANGWDAAGAAHFGFQVAWLNRFQQPQEHLSGQPKVVLEDLSGLPSLLTAR